MPRSSGNYSLPAGNPVISGTVISTAWANTTLNDVGNEITNSIPRDGSAPPTGNIPLGNFKLTGIGAATLVNDVPQYQQIQSGETNYLTSVSGTNTITATLATPTLAAYGAGKHYTFIATGTNTGATTININGLGNKTVQKDGAALNAGDITSGKTYHLIDDGTNLQLFSGAGISAVAIQNQTYNSFTTGGTSSAFTGSVSPALTALVANKTRVNMTFNATPTGSPTLTVNTSPTTNIKYYDSTGTKQFITSAQIITNWNTDAVYDGTDWVVQEILPLSISTAVIARQAIQFGALTAAGQPDLITQAQVGATIGTGVVTNGTWFASVGNGFNADGSQRNLNKVRSTTLTFSGLTGSVTNYLVYDTVADTGSFVTVADSFQPGGTIPVTNNQYTYDYVNHVMYLGNGTTAVQSNRLIIAEIDTSATVVTAIRVRAYAGAYDSGFTSTLVGASASYTKNHNFGTQEFTPIETIQCTTADAGFSVGDMLDNPGLGNAGAAASQSITIAKNKNTVTNRRCSPNSYLVANLTTGTQVALTLASWKYKITAKRNF